jgi:SAM-dependent methyltransferase
LDFGPQPPSNRFERTDSQCTETHPLVIGQCTACGLVQMIAPMAPAMVKSRFEWLTYNEPEGHLDDLVARLRKLPDIGRDARVVGVTYKDDTTLARFNRLGYTNTFRYDIRADLALQEPWAGLESVQAALDASTASRLAARHGVADLLLVRHVLEHAHDPAAFFLALCTLVRPGGYLLFEVPGCTKFIKACDYSFIWEEHITYFSSQTLAAFVSGLGLPVHELIVYPYPFEDSLIAIVKNERRMSSDRSAPEGLDSALADGEIFGCRYPELRERIQSLFGAWRRAGKRVAIFGAGHLAAKFVNMYSLRESIECIIDDNLQKQALLMPGSRLAIRGSAALAELDLCLLSLNPESERKVLARNAPFLDRGGRFLSIFALSPMSVYNASTA